MGSHSRRKSRKRRFNGNQHQQAITNDAEVIQQQTQHQSSSSSVTDNQAVQAPVTASSESFPPQTQSASFKKLKLNSAASSFNTSDSAETEGNVIFNTGIMKNFIEEIEKCPTCFSAIEFVHDTANKKGLCHFSHTKCISCDYEQKIASSKEVSQAQSEKGKQLYDINLRSIVAFREIGRGHSAMEKFCGVMNMQTPMNK